MSRILLPYTRKYILFPYSEIKPVCPLEHPKSHGRAAAICSAVVHSAVDLDLTHSMFYVSNNLKFFEIFKNISTSHIS